MKPSTFADMQPKNNLAGVLIVCSIVLLLALQLFWLQKVFEDAKDTLKKEVSAQFKSTLFSMQDSLIQTSIHSVPRRDTFTTLLTRKFRMKNPMLRRKPASDSIRYFETDDTGTKVEILFSGTPLDDDSIKTIIRPMVSRINKNKTHKNFIIRWGMDSLRMTDILNNYKKALRKGGISLPFQVKRVEGKGVGFNDEGISFITEPISVSPVYSYVSFFGNLRLYLLGKIKIEILFSIFLTSITISAFTIMYRSLLAQRRLMILKNDFISNVTHELKTPIATVSVALEALKNFKGIDNPKLTAEYLDIAQHELGRLTLLTDKVLNTSLFDETGVIIDRESIDLEKIISDIMNSMKLVFEKQKAMVEFEKVGSSFSMKASAVHITNVIYNLLDNALKYSPSNPTILIKLSDLGEKISLTVSDHGLGIPKEFHKKIFEKFFRMPTGDVHNIKGYGLGLSYVEGVVKAHGGSIEVMSEVGKGSTFIIQFPK